MEKSKSINKKMESIKSKKEKSIKTESVKNNSNMTYLLNMYKKIIMNKNVKNIPCIEKEYMIQNIPKKIDYRYYKTFIEKLTKYVNEKNQNKVKSLKMCNVNPYNKYLKKVDPEGLFFGLRNYHKNIKSNYIHKYAKYTPLLVDVGSSQLKSLPFWKSAFVKKVIAMEPSKELFDKGIQILKRDFYGKKHVTFLQGVGEKSWVSGAGGLNDFSSNYLKDMIIKGLKANIITFEFTFHYMIYNMKILMENIKSISQSGTKVIIHCINGDFLMNVFKEKPIYEVTKSDLGENNIVFYAKQKVKNTSKSKSKTSSTSKPLLPLNEVDIYFRGAQGLNNIVTEYLVIKDDIVSVFEKYGFKLLEFLPFSEQNYKEFNLEEYEFNVSKIYTTYVFEHI